MQILLLFPDAFPRYEVAIIWSDNDAYNEAWLVARKNVAIQFQSINPVIDPGSPVCVSRHHIGGCGTQNMTSAACSTGWTPLNFQNHWHQLTRRWESGEGAPSLWILAELLSPSTSVCPISQSGPVARLTPAQHPQIEQPQNCVTPPHNFKHLVPSHDFMCHNYIDLEVWAINPNEGGAGVWWYREIGNLVHLKVDFPALYLT